MSATEISIATAECDNTAILFPYLELTENPRLLAFVDLPQSGVLEGNFTEIVEVNSKFRGLFGHYDSPARSNLEDFLIGCLIPKDAVQEWMGGLIDAINTHDSRNPKDKPYTYYRFQATGYTTVEGHEPAEWEINSWIGDTASREVRSLTIDIVKAEPDYPGMIEKLNRELANLRDIRTSEQAAIRMVHHELINIITLTSTTMYRFINGIDLEGNKERLRNTHSIMRDLMQLLLRSSNLHTGLSGQEISNGLIVEREELTTEDLKRTLTSVAMLLNRGNTTEEGQVNASFGVERMPEDVKLTSDPIYLLVLMNTLGINALKHARIYVDGKALPLDINLVGTYERDISRYKLSIGDNGRGIPEANLARIREEGFTTDKNSSGLGWGMVLQIAEALGAEVSISSIEHSKGRSDHGTLIEISLPVSKQPPK